MSLFGGYDDILRFVHVYVFMNLNQEVSVLKLKEKRREMILYNGWVVYDNDEWFYAENIYHAENIVDCSCLREKEIIDMSL